MKTITDPNVRLFASHGSGLAGKALQQFYATARLAGMQLAVGFSNLQGGKRHPTGAAFLTKGIIYPDVVGHDIGCGYGLWKVALPRHKRMGRGWTAPNLNLEQAWTGNPRAWLDASGLAPTPFDAFAGTLGGAQHFARLHAVEEVLSPAEFRAMALGADDLVLAVHSGSRGFGLAVLGSFVLQHENDGVAPSSEAGRGYLAGHNDASRWARANRALIAHRFLSAAGAGGELLSDHCHNSVTPVRDLTGTAWLHRRSVLPANMGPTFIPGPRDGLSYLVKPLHDGQSNGFSLPNGCSDNEPGAWTAPAPRGRFPSRLQPVRHGGRWDEAPMPTPVADVAPCPRPVETLIRELVDAEAVKVIATLRPAAT